MAVTFSIRSLNFDSSGDLDPCPANPLFHSRAGRRELPDLRTHHDLRRRQTGARFPQGVCAPHLRASSSGGDEFTPPTQWAAERFDLLRRQMTGSAAAEVARALRFLPSLPHLTHVERGGLVARRRGRDR
ncbi:hypothetical protein B0H11DRAFT_2248363 [Mycena galericulata]|nr:hypothetical protein B0H11DRAFT_2248363 [Mycena galericulata]